MLRTRATALLRPAVAQKALIAPPGLAVRAASRFARSRRTPAVPHHRSAQPPSQLAPTASHAFEAASEGTQTTAPVPLEAASSIAQIPVHVPHDSDGVLDRATGSWAEHTRTLLSQPAIVVVRQIELLNVFVGFEQANRYQLLSPEGHLLGYLLEEETSIAGTMSRQLLRNHRPFKAVVISPDGQVLLRIHRPFAWINSRIYVSTPTSGATTAQDAKEEMQRLEAPGTSSSPASTALTTRPNEQEYQDDGEIIGETQQEWHIYRRRYNHFVQRGDEMVQFAKTDAGFLAWDFSVRDEEGKVVGSINRNFAGFARELFTDTGHYVIRFEGVIDELNPRLEPPAPSGMLPSPGSSAPSTALTPSSADRSTSSAEAPPSLPLDHRAVLLATAVTADIDYFSRQRGGLMGGGGMFMPIPIPMGGMGGAAAGEAGEVAAGAEEASGAAVPQAGRIPGADGEGPLPSTEFEEDEFAVRNRPEGVPRGEDGVVSGGGAGQGWGQEEEVMRDPWATEAPQEEGTWTWGDLWGDENGGGAGGGGGGGDWGGDGDW
ncbi:hypothetical protein NBRC10512_005579 [Rhodotorula toruloides]|uniref:RHTO0S03e03070g1_1 n=2 Tax=Rhodotorula toruloides TaxID=5286 RepID=A0A061ALR0_RHOTO|nr:scramblase family protein [Rhodotorula toruloides NP11]EMS25742.1 scramblase family protein [Rhodotorula toruloides NP11]CDR38078.1 RHTO0S03e03070g1_1 [Rhodotorula toruloides]